MQEYNPSNSIDADEWLEVDELMRSELVRKFHRGLDEPLSEDSLPGHALIHVIVENQIATNIELVPETIAKLVRQGLDRHEAVHAIGALISAQMFNLAQGNIEKFCTVKYKRQLKKLTAKRWLKGKRS